MKVSYKCDYALKIILDLAMTYLEDSPALTQIKEIAKRQDIPEKFLEQIVSILKQANYVRTIRGPKGGIALAVTPKKITVGDIVRLIDGTTAPIACVSCTQYSSCNFEERCVFKPIWEEVRQQTNRIVDKMTFADLVDKQLRKESDLFEAAGI
jgi:Rrf2 family protein